MVCHVFNIQGDKGVLREKTERGQYDADEREDIDDVYVESVEAVSFSNVIGKLNVIVVRLTTL